MSELARVRAALDAAVVGHADAKTALLLGWLARVHVLLEGPPGCGKSVLAAALADATGECRGRVDVSGSLALGAVLHRARDGALERIHLERTSFAAPALLVLDDVEHLPSDLALQLLPQLDRDGGPFVVATRASRAAPSATQPLLERFALRVRMRGMIEAWRERDVHELLDRAPLAGTRAELGAGRARALREEATALAIPDPVLDAAARWLAALGASRARAGDPFPDHGLSRALPRLLRAHALLRAAERVESQDLQALIELLSPASERPEADDVLESEASTQGLATAASEASDAGHGAARSAGDASRPSAARDCELAARTSSALPLEASAVETLVAALAGRWERGRGERHPDAAGAPRRRRPLRDLSECVDADPAELLAYLDAESAERPAVLQRERRGATPALLILRDVSASMQGPGARWSLRLVRALVAAAREQRLRVGYLEFNHVAERFTLRERFVHRAYGALLARAGHAVCAGRTSYQAALGAALAARLPRAACDVVMISDGVPVVGDPGVRSERRLARQRGWKLHTVFVGLPPVPPILLELAGETRGLAFCVAPRPASGGAATATWSLRQIAGHSR